jgi:Na+/H+-dicarboxylate symporter
MGTPPTPYEQLVGIIPTNIFEALAKGDMLAIIFVAIMIGCRHAAGGEAGRPFAQLLQSHTAVLLKIVGIVMEATPFGVFALIANAVAAERRGGVRQCRLAALAVMLGSAIQILLVHTLAAALRAAKVPVLRFYRGIIDALAVAFSTAVQLGDPPCRDARGGEQISGSAAGLRHCSSRSAPASARTARPCMSAC